MVFSSYLFIFAFLPLFLILYKLIDHRFRNQLILVASLFFYWVGDKGGIWVLLAAIIGNYVVGYIIELRKDKDGKPGQHAKIILWIGLLFNLGILAYFKYIGFLTQNIDEVSSLFGHKFLVPLIHAALPLGISFFVFQGISYIVDVYQGTISATRSLLMFATYKSSFPQLIAGPIVRYKDVAAELPGRTISSEMVLQGVHRFVIGFAKKVLLADTFAVPADAIFNLAPTDLNIGTAWLGAFSYTLQIYFDFSAYSDMAIGIGLMMGFRFPENFNFPYMATSLRDFWRRWHMTLSFWFRDYLYIPLGGNRAGPIRTYVNLFAVFVLTGLWHGAAWTFVAWGLWHGSFMVLERYFKFEKWPIVLPLKWLYTLAVVVFGWVLFRAKSFSHAFHMVALMVGLRTGGNEYPVKEYWNNALVLVFLVGVVLSFPVYRWIGERLPTRARLPVGFAALLAVFVLSSMKVLSGAYSPFLYFRF